MSLMGVYTALLHVLIGMGVTVFAVADERPEMIVLALPIVAVGYWVRRQSPGFGFPQWTLNLALIAATVWTLTTATWAIDQTVSEIARYITIIQLLRLFEKPSSRKWAQEIGLSAMLVLGAALTNVALGVGALIFVYSTTLLVTVLAHQVCVGAWKQGVTGRGRVVTGRVTRRMRRDFFRVSATALAVVLMCTVVVFVLMPRGLGQDAFFGARLQGSTRSITDFNDTVTLGQAGFINESSALVMRVELWGDLGVGPYRLRGTTLDSFDPRTSRWARSESLNESMVDQSARDLEAGLWDSLGPGHAAARVQIVQSAAPYLFSLAHADRAAIDDVQYRISRSDGTISVNRGDLGRAPEYMVRSTLPPTEMPEAASPLDPSLASPFGGTGVPGIASSILEAGGIEIDGADPTFRPRAVEAFRAHLSSGFAYTLEQVSPPLGTDPISYFLTETREGHCEYFASALAALCRCVGIDARMVTGFILYEEESVSSGLRAFAVRQSNAHAWTEVEVAPGVWVEVDPSPADGVASQHLPASGIVAQLRRVMDTVQIAWSKYVVNFDDRQQRETLGSGADAPFEGYEAIERRVQQLTDMPPARYGIVFAQAFAMGMFAFLAAYVLLTAARLFVRWWIRRSGRGSAVSAAARGTEIGRAYDSMLVALSKAGLAKPEWRPPVAHADALASVDASVSARTREIAQLYYRVAFGGRGVSAEDTGRADEALRALRERLREVKRRPGGSP